MQTVKRRDFITGTTAAIALSSATDASSAVSEAGRPASEPCGQRSIISPHSFNGVYEADHLNHVAFPLGGIGAGMICLGGTGALSHFSIRNRPEMHNEPCVFAAISLKGTNRIARVIEGQVPKWKLMPRFPKSGDAETLASASWGLPRFREAKFSARFPFATVSLSDEELPVAIEVTGWSPFEPGDTDNSSLPVASLEYRFTNRSDQHIDAIFSFNALNFLASGRDGDHVYGSPGGFVLHGVGPEKKPWDDSSFAAWIDAPGVKVNRAWYRGGWAGADAVTLAWKDIERGEQVERPEIADGAPSPGASLSYPISLAPGASTVLVLQMAWYTGRSNIRWSGGGWSTKLTHDGDDPTKETYRPWYAGKFSNIEDLVAYWRSHYVDLRLKSARFRDCFHDSTLPAEVIEAVGANLTTLKSPTILRQADGRLWAWEGSADSEGFCPGSCTHVWNYAQALAHLFPQLERTFRETEYGPSLSAEGHQVYRTAIPIRSTDQDHAQLPATDGQLGSIIRVYREWRISGDTAWLKRLWPKVQLSLDYCIRRWDPAHSGWLEGFQHNTYDMQLYGPNGLCTSIYLAALQAAVSMGSAVGGETKLYADLQAKGRARLESELFNGEYFIQKAIWEDSAYRPPDNPEPGLWPKPSPEAKALAKEEGPTYQYGKGCLSDGVIGEWFAFAGGLNGVLNKTLVLSHLKSVHRYNFKKSLIDHVNPMRTSFASADDGGLLLCTWPKGAASSIPFPYATEVWTGIEYQVASHLMSFGLQYEALEIVRACRARYDGRVRNPFSEVEAGHWYARAMSSYALLQAFGGARYDAVDRTLYLHPKITGDYRCFLSTATGYGTVGVKNGRPFVEIASGEIPYEKIDYIAG